MKKALLLWMAFGLAASSSFAQGLSKRAARDSARKVWLDADTRFDKGNWRLNAAPIFSGWIGSNGAHSLTLGTMLGVGYFPVKNLAVDLDASFSRDWSRPVDRMNGNYLTGRLSASYHIRLWPDIYYSPGLSTSVMRFSYTPTDSNAYFSDVPNSGRQNHALVMGTVWPVGVTTKLSPRTSLLFQYGISRVLNHTHTEDLPYGRYPQHMLFKLQFGLGRQR